MPTFMPRTVKYDLRKGVIRTPMGNDGKVAWDRVPIGASVWVRVKAGSSPLAGRAILLTKRPDKQMVMTGGAGYKHIKDKDGNKQVDKVAARRHGVMGAGRDVSATKKDQGDEKAYTAAKAANEPIVEAKKKLTKELKKRQTETAEQFFEAVGIKQREFTKQETSDLKDKARQIAVEAGLEEEEAEQYGNIVRREVTKAKKKASDRYAQSVGRFLHDTFGKRREKEEGLELTGEPDNLQGTVTEPLDNPSEGVQRPLGYEESERFDPVGWIPTGGASGAMLSSEGVDPRMTFEAPTMTVTLPPVGDYNSPEEMEAAISTYIEKQLDDAVEEWQEKFTAQAEQIEELLQGHSAEDNESEGADNFTNEGMQDPIGGEIPSIVPEIAAELAEKLAQGNPDDGMTIEIAPATESINLVDEAARDRAIDAYREFHETRAQVRELEKQITKLPELQNVTPAALDNMRAEVGHLTEEEFKAVVEHYEDRLKATADDALYTAIGEHWNDTVGDRVHSFMVAGASSALTAIVGEHLGERFDTGRLVEHMNTETAAWALAAMLFRKIKKPEQYQELINRVEQYNADNQDRAENQALKKYGALKDEETEIRRQMTAEELVNEASSNLLLTENLQAQREELGTALGSLSASASLLTALEGVRRAAESGEADRLTLFCGPERKAAEDRLRRLKLREGKDAIIAPVQNGWAIQTSSGKLQRFIKQTKKDKDEFNQWEKLKTDTDNVEIDGEGRAWAKGYVVPGWKKEFEDIFDEGKMKPFSFSQEQRNDIEWLDQAGGGLVTRVTGSGKTLTALAFYAKQLAKDENYIGVVYAPNGRVEQWAAEAKRFTDMNVLVIPENTNAEERARVYQEGVKKGQIIITSHRDGGSNSDLAILEAVGPDGVVIDEPQEMRSRTSAERGAGMKRVMKLKVKNKIALTATPARENPVECFNIVNWVAPGKLGFRTNFSRAFAGFKGGTNAQDALIQKMLLNEIAPFVSGDKLTELHFKVNKNDVKIKRTAEQIAKQKAIEENAQNVIDQAIEAVPAEARVGPWKSKARKKAMQQVMQQHADNLAGGAKIDSMVENIKKDLDSGREKQVIFVDSAVQRKAVTEALQGMGYKTGKEIKNIAASASGSIKGADIEKRKKGWAEVKGPSFILIDRKSAAGHNLQQGHSLHIIGKPDDAAQYLQAQGRIVRVSRKKDTGDAGIYTYKYEDSPFESAHWRKLDAEMKLLEATAPGLFKSEGRAQELSAYGLLRIKKSMGSTPILLRKAVATIEKPGSRGGKYWVDKQGNVRYGEKPRGRQQKAPEVEAVRTRPRAQDSTPEYKMKKVPKKNTFNIVSSQQVGDLEVLWHSKSIAGEKPTMESAQKARIAEIDMLIESFELKGKEAEEMAKDKTDPELMQKEYDEQVGVWERKQKDAEKDGLQVEPGPDLVNRLFAEKTSGSFALNMKDKRLIVGRAKGHEAIFDDMGMGETDYSEDHADNWLRGMIWHFDEFDKPVILFEQFGAANGRSIGDGIDEESAYRNIKIAAQRLKALGVKANATVIENKHMGRWNELALALKKEGFGEPLEAWTKGLTRTMRKALSVGSRDTKIKNPGSRGGKYWIDKKGKVRYYPKPKGERSRLPDVLAYCERQIVNSDVETAYIIDKEGNVLDRVSQGLKSCIYITEEVAKKMKGNVYTHNHPQGQSFSPQDVLTACSTGVSEIRAVSKKHVHSIRPVKNEYWADREKFQKLIYEAEETLTEKFCGLIESGVMSIPEAEATHYHALWTGLASKGVLKYKRVDRG